MVWDWRKTSMWRDGAFDKHVGNFLKKSRQTFTEETMAISKKLPAPNKYLHDNYGHMKQRMIGNYKQNDKYPHFTDDARRLAKSVPAMGFYKQAETGHHKVKPNYRVANMGKKTGTDKILADPEAAHQRDRPCPRRV